MTGSRHLRRSRLVSYYLHGGFGPSARWRMQSVEPSGGAARPTRGPLSPVVAFVALIAVLALLGSIISLTRPDTPKPNAPLTSTEEEAHFALTDEEAISRFEELHDLFRAGSMNRDPSVISVAMTSDSRLIDTALADVRQLTRDEVLDQSVFVTEDIRVLRNTPDEIVLRQVVTIEPKFVSEKTGDTVNSSPAVRRVVRWVLKQEDSAWRVFDAVAVSSRAITP